MKTYKVTLSNGTEPLFNARDFSEAKRKAISASGLPGSAILGCVQVASYANLIFGVIRPTDQVLFADYRQDCEAKKRWHKMPKKLVGKLIQVVMRKNKHLRFRAPVTQN